MTTATSTAVTRDPRRTTALVWATATSGVGGAAIVVLAAGVWVVLHLVVGLASIFVPDGEAGGPSALWFAALTTGAVTVGFVVAWALVALLLRLAGAARWPGWLVGVTSGAAGVAVAATTFCAPFGITPLDLLP